MTHIIKSFNKQSQSQSEKKIINSTLNLTSCYPICYKLNAIKFANGAIDDSKTERKHRIHTRSLKKVTTFMNDRKE